MPIVFGYLYLPPDWKDLFYVIRRDMIYDYQMSLRPGDPEDGLEEFEMDYRNKSEEEPFFDPETLLYDEDGEKLSKIPLLPDSFSYDDDFFMDFYFFLFFFYFFIDSNLCLIFFCFFYNFFDDLTVED